MYRLLFLAALVVTSCSPAYIPNTRNSPMFGGAKEFAGTVAISSGLDAQAAYSVSDHVAVMANFNTVQGKETPEGQSSFSRNHFFGEGGVGYFTRTKSARFELFGGYGAGRGTNYDSYYFFHTLAKPVVTKASYSRIFFQPSVSTNNKRFNLILTARVSMVSFSQYSTDDPAASPQVYKPASGYQLMFEPSLTARAQIAGNLLGFFQLGINKSLSDVDFSYVPMQASLGIQIHTGQFSRNY